MSRRLAVKILPAQRFHGTNLNLGSLNQMLLRDPNKILALIDATAKRNPLRLFGLSLAGPGSGFEEMSIGRRDYAETLLRWKRVNRKPIPIEVYDASSVPGTITAGQSFQLGISHGHFGSDAVLSTEHPDFNLYLERKINSVGNIHYYMVQGVGASRTDTSFPPALLAYGRKLQYASNAVGEESSKGQKGRIDMHPHEEFFNVMQTIRTDLGHTGDAISTEYYTAIFEQFAGKEYTPTGVLPFSANTFSDHYEAIANVLFFGRGNYDVARKEIVNQNAEGPYADRPMASGLREFAQQSEAQDDYNPKNPRELLNLLGKAGRRAIKRFREQGIEDPSNEMMIITRDGGEQALRRAFEADINGRDNVRINYNVSNSGGNTIKAGIQYDGYVTIDGISFSIKNISESLPNLIREQATVDGWTDDADSWEMMIVPKYKLKEAMGQSNITVVTKAKTVGGETINRGLVIGYQAGMTGLTNGGPLTSLQADKIVNRAMLDQFRVDSMVDREQIGLLSQLSLAVYNPDDIHYFHPTVAKTPA